MKTTKDMDIISLKGDREKWIDFVSKVKKNKETVWGALEGFIDEYIRR